MLTRARRKVLVIDSDAPRNAPAKHMHGFLSRDGLPPAGLLSLGRDEVESYDGEIVGGVVTELVPAGSSGFGFCCQTAGASPPDGSSLPQGFAMNCPLSRALPNDGGTSCTAPTAVAMKSATNSWAYWAVPQKPFVTHKSSVNGQRTSCCSYQPDS